MKIKYSSWIPEMLEKNEDDIQAAGAINLDNLLEELRLRGGKYERVFKNKNIFFAYANNEVVDRDQDLKDFTLITIFAPMAGG